jgi:hypothetical protein
VSRFLLAIALSVTGPLLALPVGALLLALGLRSDAATGVVALAVVLLGLIGAAACVPRILVVAASYSMLRRVVAGLVGLAAAILALRTLMYLGIDSDALSHHPSPWALVEEAMTITSFYGTLVLATFLALGKPKTRANAAETTDMER